MAQLASGADPTIHTCEKHATGCPATRARDVMEWGVEEEEEAGVARRDEGGGGRNGGGGAEMCSGSEAGSYLRLIDLCITQLYAGK